VREFEAGGGRFWVMVEGMARRPVLRLARAGGGRGLNFLAAGVLSSYTTKSNQQSTQRANTMAGRILPVALAAIVGVSIGVATFDGEFKKQRIARMEEEYKRYTRCTCAFSCSYSHSHQGTRRRCCRFRHRTVHIRSLEWHGISASRAAAGSKRGNRRLCAC
jgi:hypothetical protein